MIIRVWKQHNSLLVTIPANEADARNITVGDFLDIRINRVVRK